jgi:hypothetical protein
MTPTPKIQAVGAAGALATLITFVLQALSVDVPAEVIAPATMILTFLAGYLRSDKGKHAA